MFEGSRTASYYIKKCYNFATVFTIFLLFLVAYLFERNKGFGETARLQNIFRFGHSARQAEDTNDVTVVTSFWPVKGSKHSDIEYQSWLRNFIGRTINKIVIFTTEDQAPIFKNLRLNSEETMRIIVKYPKPFDVPCVKRYETIYRSRQWELDPERKIHVPELYAIWNGKNCLVQETAEWNPFGTEYFFWVDIGSFRNGGHSFHYWPSTERVRRIFKEAPAGKEYPIFGVVSMPPRNEYLWRPEWGPWNITLLEGGFFGGTREGIAKFAKEFWTMHDYYLDHGFFVGKDQNIMNSMIASRFENATLMIAEACGYDVWFFFQQFIASEQERNSRCNYLPPTNYANLIKTLKSSLP